MIDTHCHLTDTRLADQLDAVLVRAALSGVTDIITIGCEPADDADAIELANRPQPAGRPRVWCAVGIHPNYCHKLELPAVQSLRDLARRPRVLALGEMGLDYHWNTVPHARQRTFFEAQLHLALELDLPVVIHSREAIADTLAVMKSFPKVRAVFHSFTGMPEEARQICRAGYTVGFTGPVTYKKNDALRDAGRLCPLDQIVVETDAPYLSPEPMRSQRVNEPALVRHILARLAEVHGRSVEEIDQITTDNARRLFGLVF